MAPRDSPSCGYNDACIQDKSRIRRANPGQFLVLQNQVDGEGSVPMNYKGIS